MVGPRVRVEFTIEPFVDGHPGVHVVAAWNAVTAAGYRLDNGPFSAAVDLAADEVGVVAKLILDAALGAGAERVSLSTETLGD